MAEIGIIASVIGVAGAGFRLSLILNAVGSEVAHAGVEIHTISKGVTLFSLMLKQVGQHLQTTDSVHSHEALDTAQQITDECQLVFSEIEDMLDKVQNKKGDGSNFPSIQQRFKWCFKKHRVTYLLGQLESLKLSLLLMLGILQLGKLMVAAPKSQAKEDVAVKEDMVLQERAETQNIVVVRYWTVSRLDRLYHMSEVEDQEDRKAEAGLNDEKLLENGNHRLSIEGPPSPISTAVIKLPVPSLGALDQAMSRIRESSKDMLQVSDSVIDPLLDRWTRWQEINSRNSSRPGSRAGKYAPSIDDLYEDDEQFHYDHHQPPQYQQHEEAEFAQARGFYLEGRTTNWREPHSEAARKEMKERRKQYAGYQPSVDEGEEEAKTQKRNAPSRHIIDSSESSLSSDSDSEYEKKKRRRRRRKSSASTPEQRPKKEVPRLIHPDGAHLTRYPSSPGSTQSNSLPRGFAPPPHGQHPQRPVSHHSMSTPMIPPLHTGNVPNPYQSAQGTGPSPLAPYAAPGFSSRYAPPQPHRLQPGQRPPSVDGKSRSPSRLSQASPVFPSYAAHEEQKRQQQKKYRSSLKKGATRGILATGAVAGFLEALEGLSI